MNVYCRMISSVLENMKSTDLTNAVDYSMIPGKTFEGYLKA